MIKFYFIRKSTFFFAENDNYWCHFLLKEGYLGELTKFMCHFIAFFDDIL